MGNVKKIIVALGLVAVFSVLRFAYALAADVVADPITDNTSTADSSLADFDLTLIEPALDEPTDLLLTDFQPISDKPSEPIVFDSLGRQAVSSTMTVYNDLGLIFSEADKLKVETFDYLISRLSEYERAFKMRENKQRLCSIVLD